MPIPLIIRGLSALNTAREWFSFADEAVSFFGLAKRAAAVTAGAAVFAGTTVGAVKTVEVISQSPQERAVKQAIATHTPDITPDIRELVMKVNGENTYSKAFLYKKENRELLDAIVTICEGGNALPALQCDDAGQVKARIAYQERERKAMKRAEEYNRKFRESFSTDGIIPR